MCFVCVCLTAGDMGPGSRSERNAVGQEAGEQHAGSGAARCHSAGECVTSPLAF